MYKQGTIRTTVYFEEDIIREVKARGWKLNRVVNVACQRLRHYIETGRMTKYAQLSGNNYANLRIQYTRLSKPVKTSVRLSQETASWIEWLQFNQSKFIRYALDKTIEDARAGALEKTWQIKIEL